jgi:hypothetical protein
MQIKVCDDVEEIADGWVTAIQGVVPADFNVQRMPDAKSEVSKLLLRKLAAEKGENPLAQTCALDDIDVLVIDYDLLHLDDEGSRTTGEGVARLARTFSSCGTIVVMNQFKGPQFDLGMRGHLDSFADVNIDADLVGRAALWADLEPADGQFDPTTWTPVPLLLRAMRDLSASLEASGLDSEIMPTIGLDEAALVKLSDAAYGFLSVEAETSAQLAELTTRAFLRRSLNEEFVASLEEHAPKLLFAFAAARIGKWLDRAVLRPMDVLVDSAHLIDRLPFMIDPDKVHVADPNSWSKAATDPEATLRWNVLEKYYNKQASKASARRVFDWYRLADDEEIDQLQDDYLATNQPRFYLTEDSSRFVPGNAVTRYRADFHNSGDRRAIEKLADITYGPMRRVSFG